MLLLALVLCFLAVAAMAQDSTDNRPVWQESIVARAMDSVSLARFDTLVPDKVIYRYTPCDTVYLPYTSVKDARRWIRAEMRKQPYNFKWGALAGSSGLVGGIGWGVHETSVHKPWNFPASYNPLWWYAAESWPNKYWHRDKTKGPRFPGSTTILVAPTDAKHTFASQHKYGLFAGGIVVGVSIGHGKPWWHYIPDVILFAAGYAIGFHATYTYNLFPH